MPTLLKKDKSGQKVREVQELICVRLQFETLVLTSAYAF